MNFLIGDTVYDINGHEAIITDILTNGYIVKFVYEGDDNSTYRGNECICREEFFATPPVAHVHEDVEKARKELKELRDKISITRAEAREAEKKSEETFKNLAKFKGLENLERILTKGITHYVFEKYGEVKSAHHCGPRTERLVKSLIDERQKLIKNLIQQAKEIEKDSILYEIAFD